MAKVKELKEDIQSFGAVKFFDKVVIGGRYIPTIAIDLEESSPSLVAKIFTKIFKPYTCVASKDGSFCYDITTGKYWSGPPSYAYKSSPFWTLLGIGILGLVGYSVCKKIWT